MTRSHAGLLLLASAAWPCASTAAALAGSPVEVGLQAQVLVDDHAVESMRGLVRRILPLAKHPGNPVLRPDRAWEERYALPLSAFYDADERLYRMWYRPGQG